VSAPVLERVAFTTSRVLDFFSEKELTAQTGHGAAQWPLVILKELADNSLDACEESATGTAPQIEVTVDGEGITVADNGPGIRPEIIGRVLDYSVRVSSREAYAAPDRGAQGNALKTLMAMPFVLDRTSGRVTVTARGFRHEIGIGVDPLRQVPVIDHRQTGADVRTGTRITVHWPCAWPGSARKKNPSPTSGPWASPGAGRGLSRPRSAGARISATGGS